MPDLTLIVVPRKKPLVRRIQSYSEKSVYEEEKNGNLDLYFGMDSECAPPDLTSRWRSRGIQLELHESIITVND